MLNILYMFQHSERTFLPALFNVFTFSHLVILVYTFDSSTTCSRSSWLSIRNFFRPLSFCSADTYRLGFLSARPSTGTSLSARTQLADCLNTALRNNRLGPRTPGTLLPSREFCACFSPIPTAWLPRILKSVPPVCLCCPSRTHPQPLAGYLSSSYRNCNKHFQASSTHSRYTKVRHPLWAWLGRPRS